MEALIITGLPGSGRSTLLGHLLRSLPEDARAAVCVHHFAKEFGLECTATGTSAQVRYAEVFDFGSGCVCCSPDGDLGRLLFALASEGEPHRRKRPTHLFIETTGLADPRAFVRLFAQEEHVQAGWVLRGVVAVVDCACPLGVHRLRTPSSPAAEPEPEPEPQEEERRYSDHGATFARGLSQLRAADLIVLNKAEVGPQQRWKQWFARVCGQEMAARVHPDAVSLGGGLQWAELDAALPSSGVAQVWEAEAAKLAGGAQWPAMGMSLLSRGGAHDASFCTAVVTEEGGVRWDAWCDTGPHTICSARGWTSSTQYLLVMMLAYHGASVTKP
jgi:G3E family GTPase